MAITIHDALKASLQAKGKAVCIQLLEVNGCCGPSVQELMAHTRTPKDVHNYSAHIIDGITVFLRKPLSANDDIVLKQSGFGPFKVLSAKLHV